MKSLLVLGASSEVGIEAAKFFAKEGYHLSLAARNLNCLQSIGNDFRNAFGCQVDVYPFEATDTQSHEKFYKNLRISPSVVMYCIGYGGEHDKALHNAAEWRKILDVNLIGAISILSIACNDFKKKRGGSILCITSLSGDRARHTNYFYGLSKTALSFYADSLRIELMPSNVHVMTVKLGLVRTKALAIPERLKRLSFLAVSPESAGKSIYKAFKSEKDIAYVPFYWYFLSLLIKAVPEFIYKRIRF